MREHLAYLMFIASAYLFVLSEGFKERDGRENPLSWLLFWLGVGVMLTGLMGLFSSGGL